MSDSNIGKPVLVCTELKGVFFGYLLGEVGETIEMRDVKNCLYWSADVKGVFGLAVTGPNDNCRVGPNVSKMTLMNVTCIVEVTAEAEAAWAKPCWG